MCGILCCVCNNTNDSTSFEIKKEFEFCKNLIISRGPDAQNEKSVPLANDWYGNFFGSVLWMQGDFICKQPCTDDNGNILLWNGDIFSGSLVPNAYNCDTEIILHTLKCSDDIISTLSQVEGPFSFIYYQKSTNRLYFGRDNIGRHSLLLKIDNSKTNFIVSSVATKDVSDVIEVPAIGTYFVNLNDSVLKFICCPWKLDAYSNEIIRDFIKSTTIDIEVEYKHFPCNHEKMYSIPNNIDILYATEISNSQNIEEIMIRLLEKEEICKNVNNLIYYLNKSIECRIKKKPDYCKDCIKIRLQNKSILCNHSKVGIPFSGGVDSAIIAVIADRYIHKDESIDLINVAFERKVGSDYEVPDRITGRSTYSELLKICPQRKWNFIEVNVTRDVINKHLPHIANLIYPLNTVLDESLGCAVYFASKAVGVLFPENEPYESPCRICLLGMGADELFGGYMRHRTHLKRNGWSVLIEELHHDLARISTRNLGRDDRVVSDNGRQARYPYLDDQLVQFAQTLQPWERCYPTEDMPCGLGEKMLLRLVARKLNLIRAANFPKRAFQFGSRIANGKENAKNVSVRL